MPRADNGARTRLIFPLASVFLSLCLTFGFFEVLLRYFEEPDDKIPLHMIERGAGYVYSLNPEHPGINSHGLRGPEFEVPKPAGTFRILILGDSTSYGLFVEEKETFARRLEQRLNRPGAPVRFEVLNGGVNGYTLYNELHYFKEAAASFQPDLVIAAFCMNDPVDPMAHWGRKFARVELPEEAFADYDYYLRVTRPALTKPETAVEKILSHSAAYRFLRNRLELYGRRPARYEEVNGRRYPVYIADESPLRISDLTDPSGRPWRWITSLYDAMRTSVESSGARFAILILPLSYQLDPDYPYLPQKRFAEYCAARGIPCLDLLPGFRGHRNERLFMGRHRFHPSDVWHLSPRGHEIAAEELDSFLKSTGLVPEEKKSAPQNAPAAL